MVWVGPGGLSGLGSQSAIYENRGTTGYPCASHYPCLTQPSLGLGSKDYRPPDKALLWRFALMGRQFRVGRSQGKKDNR